MPPSVASAGASSRPWMNSTRYSTTASPMARMSSGFGSSGYMSPIVPAERAVGRATRVRPADTRSRRRWDAEATSSTAALNASSFLRDGARYPLTFRTNCSAAARISSSVAVSSGLRSVLMLRHMRETVPHPFASGGDPHVPLICGWSAQMYLNVPARRKVRPNDAPCARLPEFQAPPTAVVVCGTRSHSST